MLNFRIFLTLLLAVLAQAAEYAAPYEALYAYFAYKDEYAASAGNELEQYIANGCDTQFTPRRRCNFDEFIKYTYSGRGGYTGGFDPDDTRAYPSGASDPATMDRMAADLKNEGFVSVHVNNANMFYKESGTFHFEKIIRGIAKRINFARKAGVTTNLAATRNALLGAALERFADDSDATHTTGSLGSEVRSATGVTPVDDPNARANLFGRYASYDWFATSQAVREQNPGAIGDLIRVRAADATTDHGQMIVAMNDSLERITNDLPNC